jgi:DNA-binding NarL/FixJ family response regulator
VRAYRDGLSAALSADPGIKVVGVAAHTNEAAHRTAETSPDVLLMDTRMPDGVSVIRTLRTVDDRLQIVGLGAHDDLVPMCVEAGVDDYLPPEASVMDIRRMVLAGRRPGDPATHDQGVGNGSPFTRRELEVLTLLRRGQTNKEIATGLCIAESTAKNHVHSILQKTHLRRRSQVVALADRPSHH